MFKAECFCREIIHAKIHAPTALSRSAGHWCPSVAVGETWSQFCPVVCVKKWRIWILLRLQGSEISGTISLKMNVKFAASLHMGENLRWVLYIITYKSGNRPNDVQSTRTTYTKWVQGEDLWIQHNMGMKWAEDPFIKGMFFVFFIKVILHNGYVFRPPTHTSGHFILELPPPPPPGPRSAPLSPNYVPEVLCLSQSTVNFNKRWHQRVASTPAESSGDQCVRGPLESKIDQNSLVSIYKGGDF